MKRREGISIALTGADKFAWFVLHAEAESGVVQRFRIRGDILSSGPTVFGGTASFTLAVVRTRSKAVYSSTDDIEEEFIPSYSQTYRYAVWL